MRHLKFIILITIVCLLAAARIGFCISESAGYTATFVIFNSGSARLVSDEYIVSSTFGQSIADRTSGEYVARFGFLDAIEMVLPSYDEYDIYDIEAFSLSSRQQIQEKTWQKNSDPYFTWKTIPVVSPSLILGYSVALDEDPDDTIDVESAYSDGFGKESISDGKHTFRVKAATTSNTWGDVFSFEFWVDASEPEAANLEPAPGLLLTESSPDVSCSLSDTYSGIDAGAIKLYINDNLIDFTYEEGKVSANISQALSDGSKTVHIQAQDIAGNVLNKVWGFAIDATPPVGSIIINGGEESTNYARVRLNLEASDETTEVTHVMISSDGVFDDETWESFQVVRTDWILGEPQTIGKKTVYCKFRDEAYNVSAVYKDDIVLLSAAIDTMITSGSYSPTTETSAEFKYKSSAEKAVFSYKLDGNDWSFWTKDSSASFSGLSLGNHVFSVKSAKDLNGDFILSADEEDPVPAQWTWSIQTEGEEEKEEKVLYWKTE